MEGTENSYHTGHLYTGYWQERLELGGAGITFCGPSGPHKKRETARRWVSPLDSSQIDQPGKSHHLLREEKVKWTEKDLKILQSLFMEPQMKQGTQPTLL